MSSSLPSLKGLFQSVRQLSAFSFSQLSGGSDCLSVGKQSQRSNTVIALSVSMILHSISMHHKKCGRRHTLSAYRAHSKFTVRQIRHNVTCTSVSKNREHTTICQQLPWKGTFSEFYKCVRGQQR